MTAAYMQILIHTMNNSLFPNADSSSVSWTGPAPEIVTVQSLLYASLAISLFSVFLAMLGKQWVTRYLRNRGGSAAEKSRDRQRKLDGLETWYFYLVIESLPVMLQLALLLLGCALSLYLWTINRAVAGVILAFTAFGIVSYSLFTLAAIVYYNCPYQTPPSIVTWTIVRYLTYSDAAFARALRPLIISFPTVKGLGRLLRRVYSKLLPALGSLHCGPTVGEAAEHIPLAVVPQPPPTQIFGDVSIDWEVRKGDVRCISWVLDSITDPDVILSTVRFAADMIWYPETAQAVSPHILADLFFDCLLGRRVIPSESVHAISIGMALASVLSIQLCIDPQDEALRNLCERIRYSVQMVYSPKPTTPVVQSLLLVAQYPSLAEDPWILSDVKPEHLPTTCKLWLSRVLLQTLWRWRRIKGPHPTISLPWIGPICRGLVVGVDKSLTILNINCFLVMAICLGLQLDIRDLHAPHDRYMILHFSYQVGSSNGSHSLRAAIDLFSRRLQILIRKRTPQGDGLAKAISALTGLDPICLTGEPGLGFLWLRELLNSGYRESERYEFVGSVVRMLREYHHSTRFSRSPRAGPAWTQILLDFLLLNERFCSTTPPREALPNPGSIALLLLSESGRFSDFGPAIIPLFTSILSPTHPLQLRGLALKVFHNFMVGWFSSEMENSESSGLEKLLQAIGDPFQFNPHVPSQATTSTEDGRRIALARMLDTASRFWPGFLSTPAKVTMAIRHLEELHCFNTAQVVITRAWTVGVINPIDRGTWSSIENVTLRFYQTHGMGRLNALKQHITDTSIEPTHKLFLDIHYGDSRSTQVGTARRRALAMYLDLWTLPSGGYADLCVSRLCYLRMLYRLFGCDPTTWKEVVGVEEAVDEVDAVPEISFPFAEWACDYP